MENPDRQLIRGNRNPSKYGFSLRASSGTFPDQSAIETAAPLLGRAPFFIDEHGYECELIGATVHPSSGSIAYVESRSRKLKLSSIVDVSIKVHLQNSNGRNQSTNIKYYNPFFGCDIDFFQWIGDVALLIYTEKHDTYICAIGSTWPPEFIEIEDRWIIHGETLAYIGYKQDAVKRILIPDLIQLEPMSISDAKSLELLPDDPYAT